MTLSTAPLIYLQAQLHNTDHTNSPPVAPPPGRCEMERAEAERMEADYSRAYAEFSVKHAQNAPLVEALNKVGRGRGEAQGLFMREWEG